MQDAPITIVSGLPRSGTSMMMRMLEAGGVSILTDGEREADIDNPRGYYELEKVKQVKTDASWLPQAQGKAFKMVSMLLLDLPAGYRYKILFMKRRLEEILASEQKMLERLGKTRDVDDATMAAMFTKHLSHVKGWLDEQPHMEWLEMDFNAMLTDPKPWLDRLPTFLEHELDLARMAQVVEPTLYRNRADS